MKTFLAQFRYCISSSPGKYTQRILILKVWNHEGSNDVFRVLCLNIINPNLQGSRTKMSEEGGAITINSS